MKVNLEYSQPAYLKDGESDIFRKNQKYLCAKLRKQGINVKLVSLLKNKDTFQVDGNTIELDKFIQSYATKFLQIPDDVLTSPNNDLKDMIILDLKTKNFSHEVTDFDSMTKKLLMRELTNNLGIQVSEDSDDETKGYFRTNADTSKIHIKYTPIGKKTRIDIKADAYSDSALNRQGRIINTIFRHFDYAENLKQQELNHDKR